MLASTMSLCQLARQRNLLENASWPTALALVLFVVAIAFGVVIWSIGDTVIPRSRLLAMRRSKSSCLPSLA